MKTLLFLKKKQFEIVVCKMTATMSHAQCVEIHWWKSQMISVIFSLQMSPILYPVTPPTTVPCSLLFHLSHSQTSLSNNNFLQDTVKSLIYDAPNPKTYMIIVLSCSCLCPIHWSQVLSREWRCSWSSADSRCSNYIWVISNFNANQGATYIRGLMIFTKDTLLLACQDQVWSVFLCVHST